VIVAGKDREASGDPFAQFSLEKSGCKGYHPEDLDAICQVSLKS